MLVLDDIHLFLLYKVILSISVYFTRIFTGGIFYQFLIKAIILKRLINMM